MAAELLFFRGENQAKDYLEVLKTTYQAVKEADSDAKVIDGGIAKGLQGKEGDFWEEMLVEKGKNYVDIISVHSIGGPNAFNLKSLKEFMAENQLTRAVWITEIQFGGPEEVTEEEKFRMPFLPQDKLRSQIQLISPAYGREPEQMASPQKKSHQKILLKRSRLSQSKI